MEKDTRASFIYYDLERSIIEGTLLPGDPLLELELCDTYAVSRTPVREAIRRLHHDGLVEAAPFASARVARVSQSDVLSAFDARIWLEPPVFARATENQSPALLSELQSIMGSMPEAPNTRAEALKAIDADFSFHRAVFESVGNRYATDLLKAVQLVTRRAINLSPPPRFLLAREEHLAILAAFLRGDSAETASLVRRHVISARTRYSGGYPDQD